MWNFLFDIDVKNENNNDILIYNGVNWSNKNLSIIVSGNTNCVCINGTSGTSGVDGIDGKDGLNGVDGTSGVDGIDGKDGTDGTSGRSGSSGSSGTSGKDGFKGLSGTSGTSGLMIISGTTGMDGTSGTSGKDGKDSLGSNVIYDYNLSYNMSWTGLTYYFPSQHDYRSGGTVCYLSPFTAQMTSNYAYMTTGQTDDMLLGIFLYYEEHNKATFLLKGFYKFDFWNWIPGRSLYLNPFDGSLNQEQFGIYVGKSILPNIIFFEPK